MIFGLAYRVIGFGLVVALFAAMSGVIFVRGIQLDNAKANLQLSQLETRQKQTNVNTLEAFITKQNAAIGALAEKRRADQRRYLTLRRELNDRRAEHALALNTLKSAEGESCQDGIDLINKELDL